MELMPQGFALLLYGVVALGGVGLITAWGASARARRNAGFASKAALRRHLSAKAVLRATEIRPGLLAPPAPRVSLSKAPRPLRRRRAGRK
ncbi:hypothetical protein [Streptomyces sp. NPDC051561]|uniref:hypothetical protein n=1 Tax=Streptomyces sp. NPDC051561 TaxID=3365658 RepID=UPI0037A553AC